MPAPLPSDLSFRLRRLVRALPGGRRLVSDPPPATTEADAALAGAPSSARVLDGMLAEHYVALLCADLASWRPKLSPVGVREALPLVGDLPSHESSRAMRMVLEVYGPVVFLPFRVQWLASFVDMESVLHLLAPPHEAQLASTLLLDGFDGALEDLVALSSLVEER